MQLAPEISMSSSSVRGRGNAVLTVIAFCALRSVAMRRVPLGFTTHTIGAPSAASERSILPALGSMSICLSTSSRNLNGMREAVGYFRTAPSMLSMRCSATVHDPGKSLNSGLWSLINFMTCCCCCSDRWERSTWARFSSKLSTEYGHV